MLYANTSLEARATATPKARASCPVCDGEVLAKCGKVVCWHWAHVGTDCDPWSEPMTQWHLDWQEEAPPERREVVVGPHRADLITTDNTVIELQHSSIPVDVIRAREQHYDRMAWIFDAREAYEGQRYYRDGSKFRHPDGVLRDYAITRRLDIRDKGHYVTFRWKHPRKTVAFCDKPVYLDLDGNKLLAVQKIHPEAPCGGWGYLVGRKTLVNWINGGAA